MSRWFLEYLDAFAACGRGQRGATVLEHYDVPLLVTTDAGVMALTSEDEVVAVLQHQVDDVRGAGYDRTRILDAEVTVLNAASALYRGTFSRQRSDGQEISRLTATYLVTDAQSGRRITVLAVHTP